MRLLVRISLLLLFCAASLAGCDKTAPSPPPGNSQASANAPQALRSLENVHLVEDHSQALALWAKAGVRDATVLHIDAHHDLLPALAAENLDKLRTLAGNAQFAELEAAGRYSTPREKALFGINNYLNAAYQLGIVKKIFWAYPYQGTPTREKLEAYRNHLIDVAIPRWKPQFRALQIVPPFLVGTLGGVPVTIGSLTDFKETGTPLLLDIDLDYFPVLYRNPVSTPYLQLLGVFARFLQEQRVQPMQTVIAYSHNGGHLPIELRYLGPWLKTLLTEPERLDKEPVTPWQVKAEATHREHFKQFDAAAELYEGLIKDYPNDPDPYFSLAMNLIARGGEDRVIPLLEKARQLDPTYMLGYVAAAGFYNQQHAPDIAIKLLEEAERLVPDAPAIWDALGNLHHNQGNYRKAESYYRKILVTDPSSPMIFAYLGDSLFYQERYQDALPNYLQAIANSQKWEDSYIFPDVWLQLAKTQEKLGRSSEAIETLQHFLSDYPDPPEELRKEAQQQLARLNKTP